MFTIVHDPDVGAPPDLDELCQLAAQQMLAVALRA